MNVTKQQIRNGIVRYLENDAVNAINDKPVKMAAAVLAGMIRNNDRLIDRFFRIPAVGIILGGDDPDTYDIDTLFEAIDSAVSTYGNFDLKIPLLPKPFRFNANDFRALKQYIEEGGNGNA